MASLAEVLRTQSDVLRQKAAKAQADMQAEAEARKAEREQIKAEAAKLKALLLQTFVTIPLVNAKVDPEKATRKQQDTIGHGRLYDRAMRQVEAIATDVGAKAHVINCLKHAWEDQEAFAAAAGCFVSQQEARKLGYRW